MGQHHFWEGIVKFWEMERRASKEDELRVVAEGLTELDVAAKGLFGTASATRFSETIRKIPPNALRRTRVRQPRST